MKKQRGGTLLGFILGALAGLGVALALAVYITKVPMPFMTKAPSRTADDPAAEAKKNRDWDPNAALSGKPAVKEAGAVVDPAAAPAAPVAAGAPAPSADPVGDLVKAKADASAKAAAPPPPAAAPAAPAAEAERVASQVGHPCHWTGCAPLQRLCTPPARRPRLLRTGEQDPYGLQPTAV